MKLAKSCMYILLHHHYITSCVVLCMATPHPYTNLWPEGCFVVLHVYKHVVLLCSLGYHNILTYIQNFSFITCSINQLCAQICPYYNVWPGAIYCCFNKNYKVYNILNMTLHAGLANPTCLQSFMVRDCSVCELLCLNQRRRRR